MFSRETGPGSPNPRREDNLSGVEFTGRRSGLTGGNTPGIRGTLPEKLRYFYGEQVTCHQWQLILHLLRPAFHAVYRRQTLRQEKKSHGADCPDWRHRCLSYRQEVDRRGHPAISPCPTGPKCPTKEDSPVDDCTRAPAELQRARGNRCSAPPGE